MGRHLLVLKVNGGRRKRPWGLRMERKEVKWNAEAGMGKE